MIQKNSAIARYVWGGGGGVVELYVLNMYDHVNYVDVIGKVSVISPFVWKDINGEQLKRRIIEI